MTYNTQNQPTTQTVNLSNETYMVIDRNAGFVAIHEGQQTGEATDWGGKVIAWMTLEQAEAVAQMLNAPVEPMYEPLEDEIGYLESTRPFLF